MIGTLELNNHEPVLRAKCFGNTYSITNDSRPQSLYQPVFPTIQKGLTWLAKTQCVTGEPFERNKYSVQFLAGLHCPPPEEVTNLLTTHSLQS